MQLQVHPLSKRIIEFEYGSSRIRLTARLPFFPLLLSDHIKSTEKLSAYILLEGDETLLNQITEDAGHALYRQHMHELVQWMDKHVAMGESALGSLNRYYKLIDLDIDELAPETVYKHWQRWKLKKNRENYLPKPKNLSYKRQVISKSDVFPIAAEFINDHPHLFYNRSDVVDRNMLRKAFMYLLHKHAAMTHSEIATEFGVTRQNVSLHIADFTAILKHSGATVLA